MDYRVINPCVVLWEWSGYPDAFFNVLMDLRTLFQMRKISTYGNFVSVISHYVVITLYSSFVTWRVVPRTYKKNIKRWNNEDECGDKE